MADTVGEKLFDATKDGCVSEVSTLLRDHPEIDVNWTNPEFFQWTPLHIASSYDHVELVKLLLAHPDINFNVKNKFGKTPFSLCCWQGKVSVVKLLLKDPRVDVTMDDNSGCTPLWWATWDGRHEVVEWLIASGRDLGDVKNKKGNWDDGKDYTALEIARKRED